jgi:hypothetical protein
MGAAWLGDNICLCSLLPPQINDLIEDTGVQLVIDGLIS